MILNRYAELGRLGWTLDRLFAKGSRTCMKRLNGGGGGGGGDGGALDRWRT